MSAFYFSTLAILSILCVIGLIAFRSPRSSALCLLGFMLSLACLFLQLNASGVALIQILVGIGLVLGLFVFTRMTEQTKTKRKTKKRTIVFALTLLCLTGSLSFFLMQQLRQIPRVSFPDIQPDFGTVAQLAQSLHTQYVVPFALLGILILLAIVSVLFLLRKDEM